MRLIDLLLIISILLLALYWCCGCASTRTMVLHEGDSVTITSLGIWDYIPKKGSEQELIYYHLLNQENE